MKTVLFLLVGLLANISVAQVPAGEEKILGFIPSKSGLTFQVASGTCTTKNDFVVQIDRSVIRKIAMLRLLRVRPDRCLPLIPMGIQIQFTYAEIGISTADRFKVVNPNGVVEGWMWPEASYDETTDSQR
jgi:hypothetical protein